MLNVYEAAQERIRWTLDRFPKVILSFSGGKDSSIVMHLVAEECRQRSRRVALLFIDLEAQYVATVDHVSEMAAKYDDCFDLHWVALPISLRNAVSVFEPQWVCWDRNAKEIWVRHPPKCAITEDAAFPFYEYAMEFEDFVPAFADWYSGGELTASIVGIRTQESLRRWKAVHLFNASSFEDRKFAMVQQRKHLVNIYPIFDWKTEDIWSAVGQNNWAYNRIYDLMYQAGKSIHECRICQPYGDDQREGLDLFRKCEADTWAKVVRRVAGANYGNIYCGTTLLGNRTVKLPKNMTWRRYVAFLLETVPRWQKHWYSDMFRDWMEKWDTKWQTYRDENVWKYSGKARQLLDAFFARWEKDAGVPIEDRIRDEEPSQVEAQHLAPSYRRLAKVVMKNDICGHGLDVSRMPRLYYRLKEYEVKYGN